jgi:ribosomal protein S18 acetylase RimI-like enzyme
VRAATRADLEAISKLAGELVRQHYRFDPERFLLVDNVEEGYAWWFGRELRNRQAVLLVACCGGEVAGYAYGRMEERNWNALLEACGALHDVYVDRRFRRRGVATQLLQRMLDELEGRGAPRVVLYSAVANKGAHRLFGSLGFRRTMVEMTRERGARRPGKKGSAPKAGTK